MYVKNKMTSRPFTVSPDTSVSEAFAIIKERQIKRLPVVKNGELVGIVSKTDLQRVSPSNATTLSIFELNYELGKLKVKDAMTKNPITVDEKALLEEAAVLMRDNNIRALPVMKDGVMTGIITETDVLDAFIELMGFADRGARITVQADDIPGTLSDVSNTISKFNVNISHLAIYGSSNNQRDMVIRINAADSSDIQDALREKGYKLV